MLNCAKKCCTIEGVVISGVSIKLAANVRKVVFRAYLKMFKKLIIYLYLTRAKIHSLT